MLDFKTFKALLAENLTNHGVLVVESEGHVDIFPLSKDGLISIISQYVIHVDSDVISELKLDTHVGTRTEFQIHAASLYEYDSMFWHYNNGFTGIDDYCASQFVRVMQKNKFRFCVGDSSDYKVCTPREFVANTPDRVVLWLYALALSLAIQSTLDSLWVNGVSGMYGESILSGASLLEVHGLVFDLFARNIASFKGLSKICGDWAIPQNQQALVPLGCLCKKVYLTIRAPYNVCAHGSFTSIPRNPVAIHRFVELVKDTLKYYRLHGAIALVMCSFLVGAVMPLLDTPAEAIDAAIPVISTYGRVVHSLFVKMRDSLNIGDLNHAESN